MSELENPPERGLRVPPLLTLLVLGLLATLAVRSLSSTVQASGFLTIDTRRSRVEPLSHSVKIAPWVDPRWERRLSRELALLADVGTLDRAAFLAVVGEIEAYSFVERVGVSEVLWPDGMSVEIQFRKPVACLAVDGEFLTASHSGIVLPGRWSAPPEIDGAALPVLARDSFSRALVRPGVQLFDPDLLDALAVSRSMTEFLDVQNRSELGPVVIDAMQADLTSLEVFGIVLDLEYERRIVFGRSPVAGEPGELPPQRKWDSVARGLRALQEGLDWVLLDVRWDDPTFLTRAGEEGTL
jgi:hypothetical protein